MINDFKPTSDTIKFVDDSSIFEVVLQNTRSKLDQTLSKTCEWVEHNYMELNGKKTKELRISFSDHNFGLGNQLMINNESVGVVKKAKLLGLTISHQLKWNDYINDICSKASKYLNFLRILKRAGFEVGDLVKVYCCYIRPILEYAYPIWHSSIPEYSGEQVESIQKRALPIVIFREQGAYSDNDTQRSTRDSKIL